MVKRVLLEYIFQVLQSFSVVLFSLLHNLLFGSICGGWVSFVITISNTRNRKP